MPLVFARGRSYLGPLANITNAPSSMSTSVYPLGEKNPTMALCNFSSIYPMPLFWRIQTEINWRNLGISFSHRAIRNRCCIANFFVKIHILLFWLSSANFSSYISAPIFIYFDALICRSFGWSLKIWCWFYRKQHHYLSFQLFNSCFTLFRDSSEWKSHVDSAVSKCRS